MNCRLLIFILQYLTYVSAAYLRRGYLASQLDSNEGLRLVSAFNIPPVKRIQTTNMC